MSDTKRQKMDGTDADKANDSEYTLLYWPSIGGRVFDACSGLLGSTLLTIDGQGEFIRLAFENVSPCVLDALH